MKSKLEMPVVAEREELVPGYQSLGAAGLDLCAKEETILHPDTVTQVGTGVKAKIPDGHVGLVFIRSSMGTKYRINLANKVGVIDSDYTGEIKMMLVNEGLGNIRIDEGERVAQLVIIPCAQVDVMQVDELPETERGEGGFGSTGG